MRRDGAVIERAISFLLLYFILSEGKGYNKTRQSAEQTERKSAYRRKVTHKVLRLSLMSPTAAQTVSHS